MIVIIILPNCVAPHSSFLIQSYVIIIAQMKLMMYLGSQFSTLLSWLHIYNFNLYNHK